MIVATLTGIVAGAILVGAAWLGLALRDRVLELDAAVVALGARLAQQEAAQSALDATAKALALSQHESDRDLEAVADRVGVERLARTRPGRRLS